MRIVHEAMRMPHKNIWGEGKGGTEPCADLKYSSAQKSTVKSLKPNGKASQVPAMSTVQVVGTKAVDWLIFKQLIGSSSGTQRS